VTHHAASLFNINALTKALSIMTRSIGKAAAMRFF